MVGLGAMRPFFNFLADTLRSCKISLHVGKKIFCIVLIIFHVALPNLTPKIQKKEKISISEQSLVLQSSVMTHFNGNMHVSISVAYKLYF